MEKKKRKELLGIILKEVEKITPVVDQTFLADLISFKVEQFVDQELDRAREEVYTDLIKEFDMLEEEDRVAKWFILGVLKERLSKLTTN